VGCAPSANTPDYVLESLPRDAAHALIAPFSSVLRRLELRVQDETQTASRYDGTERNAFLFIVDRFYQQNPGFCPLETNAFHADASGKVFLTLAARGLEVRGFVYDLAARPAVTFAVFAASSQSVLNTQPCRTVNASGKKDNA
jgi:hypothetical protein